MGLAYFKFERLSDKVKEHYKIKSKSRIDCTYYYNPTQYKGLTDFVNKKGQLFLYLTTNSVAYKGKTLNNYYESDVSLTGSSMNFSSILYDCHNCKIGYGNPNPKYWLGKGKINPLYNYRYDAYLFKHNTDYSQIELIVQPYGLTFIKGYYNKFLNGEYDELIEHCKDKSEPFYDYSIT